LLRKTLNLAMKIPKGIFHNSASSAPEATSLTLFN
jgi:hypothetical protein